MKSTMYFINQKAENSFPAQKHLKIFRILYDGCEFLKIHVCYFVVQLRVCNLYLEVMFLFNEREIHARNIGITGVCFHAWFHMGFGGRDPTLVWQVLLYTEIFSQHWIFSIK